MKTKKFSKVNIEISNICNLQCSFCPEVIRTKGMMDLHLFRRVIEQVSPLTDQVCFHLMGDPLVHPKLSEMVQICEEFKTPIFFVTNGVLLRTDKAALLLNPAFRQVNFSLHSFVDNYGDKDPTSYLENIFSFTEKALEVRPELYINYRLWNLAEARGQDDRNIDFLTRIEQRFGKTLPRQFDVKSTKSIPIKGRLYLHYDTEFIWPSLQLPVLGNIGTCYGLSTHFGVLMDGTVVPCCLDKEGNIPLGNIKEHNVSDILANPRSQAILQGFRDRKLKENLCQRCQYIERFQKPTDINF